jgi:uncharacterized damage-inducible protein DinB
LPDRIDRVSFGEEAMSRIPKSWLVSSLKKSHLVFAATLGDVSQEQAQQLRDGPDGWTILEIVCHVRDYQEIFLERLRRMIEENSPILTPYDEAARQALVTDHRYAQQNLRAVFQDYVQTRDRFIEQVLALDEAQLERIGIHPMTGQIDPSVTIFHIVMHDIDHAEQIARVRGLPMPE